MNDRDGIVATSITVPADQRTLAHRIVIRDTGYEYVVHMQVELGPDEEPVERHKTETFRFCASEDGLRQLAANFTLYADDLDELFGIDEEEIEEIVADRPWNQPASAEPPPLGPDHAYTAEGRP